MKPSLVLALLLLTAPAARADDVTPQGEPGAQTQADRPDPRLARLEQVLGRALEAKRQGQFAPERYEEFLVQFRASLDQAWSLSRRAPPDTAVYARIKARLGDTAQALAALGPALEQDPQNPNLRLTFGEVSFEKKDYPAALAEANAVLERDPSNKRAIALKRFSEGRRSGAALDGTSPLQLGAAETGSVLDNPQVVEAGRRATARMNAIHFTDKAMARLKINDPGEALRYATLAEASDPTFADAPMQQGLAYMGLKQPGKAFGRFARAEELWQARSDQQADMARTMKERAAAQMAAQPQEQVGQPIPTSDPRRTNWPLGGATAGLLLAGMGASLLKRDEESEERWRKSLLVAGIIGIGVLGGGLLGYAAYTVSASALTAGGGTLALAGGGTMGAAAAAGEGTVLATAAGGLAGGAAGAKAAEGVESEPTKREAPPNGAPGQAPGPLPVPLPIPMGTQTQPDDCSVRQNEDVLPRFIDGTRLSPGFVKIHDQNGGHTEAKHVKKSIEYLIGRLGQENAASTFDDMNVAEAEIRETVSENLSSIAAWMLTAGAPKAFDRPGQVEIGSGVSRNSRVPSRMSNTRVVLLKRYGCRILILTAYPY